MVEHLYGGPVGNPYDGPGFRGHNKAVSKGGPKGVQRSTALQLKEHEPLFTTYEHLAGQDRSDAALLMLRKAASVCKPIMQKHGWRVKVLAEFLPPESNLLGLNINKGHKICIRLRYHNNHDLFLPFEDVVDTLLHELCHNIWSAHDSNFHKLWEELRDEYEALVRKGYTGEGFLSEGRKLGGSHMSGSRAPHPHELRELARRNAEKRRAQAALSSGSGQKLGGTPVNLPYGDSRKAFADAAVRRKAISSGCASGSQQANELSQQAESDAFKTKAEDDDANNLAISKALQELMEQEEDQKLSQPFEGPSSGVGLAWNAKNGLYDAGPSRPTTSGRHDHPSEEEQMKWAMEDSMRCAGESSLDIDSAQKAPSGCHASTGEPDRIASPVDSDRTATPEDSDRTASPDDLERTTSPKDPERTASPEELDRTAVSADHLPVHNHANDTSSKRKREPSRTNSSLSATHPPKQERIEEETISPDLEPLSSFAEPVAGDDWACEVCTCINPLQFLTCDACGVERPQSVLLKSQPPKRKPIPSRVMSGSSRNWEVKPPPQRESLGWSCRCGTFMEHKWWTCSVCGTLKASS